MGYQKLVLPGGDVIEIRQDRIDVSSALPAADPNWHFTDAAGHEHRRVDGSLPTLHEVPDGEPYWCQDCRDEHQDSHLECVECGEAIRPGAKVDLSRRFMTGMREILINGEPATEEEVRALIEASGPRP